MKTSTLIFLSIFVILSVSVAFYYFVKSMSIGGSESTNITELTKEKRIVAFGDSLTYGYGLEDNNYSYPSLLQKKIDIEGYKYKVINIGVNGETTSDGLLRVNSALSYEPDLIILEFGANDYLKRLSPQTAQTNLENIIKFFDENKVKVVLVNIETSSLLPFPNNEEFSKIVPELAKKYGLVMIPSMLSGVLLNSELTLEDRLHPNKDGYIKVVNENIWPYLKSELIK